MMALEWIAGAVQAAVWGGHESPKGLRVTLLISAVLALQIGDRWRKQRRVF